jgi:hypothetical protein
MGNLNLKSLEITDFRCPGQPMVAFPLKLPPDAIAKLKSMANQKGTSQTALARTLLIKIMNELDQST